MSRRWVIVIVGAGVAIIALMIATAIVALRVNHEIENAFVTVNKSINNSNDTLDSRNSMSLQARQNIDTSRSGSRELITTITTVRSSSQDMTSYIDGLLRILENSQTDDADLNAGTQLLAEGPEGKILQQRLGKYKKGIDSLMRPYPLKSPIPIDITPPKMSEGKQASWQVAYFHMVPKIAAITILNKFKNDVKKTEAMCMERLIKEK